MKLKSGKRKVYRRKIKSKAEKANQKMWISKSENYIECDNDGELCYRRKRAAKFVRQIVLLFFVFFGQADIENDLALCETYFMRRAAVVTA